MPENNPTLLDRFISQYYPEQSAPRATLPALARTALEQLHARLRQANRPLREAGLTAKDREALRGKTGPLLTTLLSACARGLRRCPSFAQQIETSADAVTELASQRMAIAGDIKTLELIIRRADGCWYAVTGAAQEDARKVVAGLDAAVGPEASRTPAQIAIAGFFERPLRMHQAGLQAKKAAAQQQQQQADAAVEQVKDRVGRQRQVHQMLADFAAGKGLLPAALSAADDKKGGKK